MKGDLDDPKALIQELTK